jgi:hypothetical protein
MTQLAIFLRASNSFDEWVTPVLVTLFLLAMVWVAIYRNWRRTALSRLASRLGLEFRPTLPADGFGLKNVSFYKADDLFTNYMRGSIAGRDTMIFDQHTWVGPDYMPRGNAQTDQTVVAFRVPSDTFCRDRGVRQPDTLAWRVEKVGEWIFVLRQYALVKPADIESFVEQARSEFQAAIDPAAYQPTLRPPATRY